MSLLNSETGETPSSSSSPFESDDDEIEKGPREQVEETPDNLYPGSDTEHGNEEIERGGDTPSQTSLLSLRQAPSEGINHEEPPVLDKAAVDFEGLDKEGTPAVTNDPPSDFTPMSDKDIVEDMLKSAPEHPATGLEAFSGVNSDTTAVSKEPESSGGDGDPEFLPFGSPEQPADSTLSPLDGEDENSSQGEATSFPNNEFGFNPPASEDKPEDSSDDPTSLFSSTPLFAPPAGSEESGSAASLFGSPPSTTAEPPPLPKSASQGKALRNVKPSPLGTTSKDNKNGSRPTKKKARLSNGTVILLLIMVGSISGAGLAAFFVPVDYPAGKANVVIENEGNENLEGIEKKR